MDRLRIALFLVAAGMSTAQAAESNLTVVGGIDLGFKDIEIEVGREAGSGEGGGGFASTYVTLNPNIAFAYGSYYVALSYDKSVSADPVAGDEGGGGGTPSGTLLDFSRTDTTLTFGYRIDPSLSVFAGYTRGFNDFRETSYRDLDDGPGTNFSLVVTEINYTEEGPFAGLSYTKSFGESGTLSLSLGYAKLDGELTFTRHPQFRPNESFTGDNTGFSYGITWSGPLTAALGYRVGIKATRYEMEQGPNNPQDIIENYINFFMGVSNYF